MRFRIALAAALATATAASANVMYLAPVAQTFGDLQIYGTPGVTGTLTSPSGYSASFAIGANHTAHIAIPDTYDLTTPMAITNNGFVLKTDNPQATIGAYLSGWDFTTLMDSRGLGTAYTAMAYAASNARLNRPPTYRPSQLAIVATEDGTQVQITPPSAGLYTTSATDWNSPVTTTPFTITLNKGQAVLYNSRDVVGTKIDASAPLAVFGGNYCGKPDGSSSSGIPAQPCGPMISALPSEAHFTTSAVIPTARYSAASTIIGDRVRVVAKADNTIVRWNGSTVATLNDGEFVEFDSGAGGIVTASAPVHVAKFTKLRTLGNVPFRTGVPTWYPGMTWVPGTDQWTKHYSFSIAEGTSGNFLDIAILSTGIGSLYLNGQRVSPDLCIAIGSGYSTCEISVGSGIGTIWADNPFLALLTENERILTYLGADFLPEPVLAAEAPEPTTLMLAFGGLAGLWRLRRRA